MKVRDASSNIFTLDAISTATYGKERKYTDYEIAVCRGVCCEIVDNTAIFIEGRYQSRPFGLHRVTQQWNNMRMIQIYPNPHFTI